MAAGCRASRCRPSRRSWPPPKATRPRPSLLSTAAIWKGCLITTPGRTCSGHSRAPVPSGPSAYVTAAVADLQQFRFRDGKEFGDSNCKKAVGTAITAGYRAAGLPVPAVIANRSFQVEDLQRLGWTIVDYNKTGLQEGETHSEHRGRRAQTAPGRWSIKAGADDRRGAHVSSGLPSRRLPLFARNPAYRDGNATVIALRPPPELFGAACTAAGARSCASSAGAGSLRFPARMLIRSTLATP